MISTDLLAPANPTASAAAINLALGKILTSDDFSRAQRMRELMRFLVEQKLSGSPRETNEYAVGIEVFKRNPATYNTCTDPIVRVQVGRLRDRLRAYYAGAGSAEPIRFIIPIGSYMPEIALMAEPSPPPASGLPMSPPPVAGIARHYLLAHCALMYFDNDAYGAAFVRGLNEELVHQLYCAFGATIVPHTAARSTASVSHRLEGSVRIDGDMVRLALRLVDNTAGSMVWSQQFDGRAALSIDLQDQLAAAACAALNLYFAHG
jgi:TolB-like protein